MQCKRLSHILRYEVAISRKKNSVWRKQLWDIVTFWDEVDIIRNKVAIVKESHILRDEFTIMRKIAIVRCKVILRYEVAIMR